MFIKEMLKEPKIGTDVTINGWVRTNRNSGAIGFLAINDGSTLNNVQIVYKDDELFGNLKTGDAIQVIGTIVESKGKQDFEIAAKSLTVINTAAEDYPLQKKRHTVEYLREIAHLRPKSNLMMAVMRIRSVLAQEIHAFFLEENFVWVATPIITSNDAEGAGEAFTVTTRGDGNYQKDFFRKKASLTVSGQLHAEAYAQAFGRVYTFGPTFRAENSNTSRHASEFWMMEPEIAFAGIEEDMDNAEQMIKYVIKNTLEKCSDEFDFLNKFVSKGITDKMNNIVNSKFAKLKYVEMIDILKKAMEDGVEFEDTNIEYGLDFGSEHERYIAEKVIGGPVFATHYPKEIKSFYMRITEDNEKTVDSFDLLIPGVGELLGGSARENNLETLRKRMKESGTPEEGLEWYLELRKFGGAPSAGYGIGFERLVMFVTGVENIRDVIPFPRTPRNLKF